MPEGGIRADGHVFRDGRIFAHGESGQRAVDHLAQRIKVIGGVGLSLAGQGFRGHESGRAGQRAPAAQGDESGIGEGGPSVHPEDVVRFDVAVDKPSLMEFLQTVQQAVEHGEDLLAVHPSVFVQTVGQGVGEIFAAALVEVVGGIHGIADMVVGDLDVTDLEQVRMIAVPVVFESGEFAFGIIFAAVKDLQRHAGADGVFGEPNFPVGSGSAFLPERASAEGVAGLTDHSGRSPA